MELAFVRAVAHAVASRQRFLENLERPLQIAGAHLGLGKRDLDEAVVDHDVLPAQAFGAVAHGLESIGEGAVVDRRPADKELAERSEHGEIVIAHDSSELGDARPSARTVSRISEKRGVVTLSKRRREAGLPCGTSSGRDDLAPRGHRRGA